MIIVAFIVGGILGAVIGFFSRSSSICLDVNRRKMSPDETKVQYTKIVLAIGIGGVGLFFMWRVIELLEQILSKM